MIVLLVDGVGNAVKFDRQQDAITITIAGVDFMKTRDVHGGLDVYRLVVDGLKPAIRHVNKHLTTERDVPS